MADKFGNKTGGRKKGTPNKKTLELGDQLEKLGCNPVEILARLATGVNEEGEPVLTKKLIRITRDGERFEQEIYGYEPEITVRAASELMQYQYPKRKAIEHSTESGKAVVFEMQLAPDAVKLFKQKGEGKVN